MIGTDIAYAAELLKKDQLVAIPTETVYGLAGNAYSNVAVSKIFSVKKRPNFDPLIVHCHSIDQMAEITLSMPKALHELSLKFMPGPLTLLLEKNEKIPDLVTAGSPYVAVRIPNHPMTIDLLKKLPFPLAAPSANPFGYISPTCPQHVQDQMEEDIPYILDGGTCTVGVESTIVGLINERPTILRKGGLSISRIEAVIGYVAVRTHSSSNPDAPGMLKSHYAPKVKVILSTIEAQLDKFDNSRIGSIVFSKVSSVIPAENQVVLSTNGDYEEAARNLFAGLRYLDTLDIDVIAASLLPEEDLGIAINDRLRRAAAE